MLEKIEKVKARSLSSFEKDTMSETNRIIQLFRERTSKEFLIASSLTPSQGLRTMKRPKQLWMTIRQTMK